MWIIASHGSNFLSEWKFSVEPFRLFRLNHFGLWMTTVLEEIKAFRSLLDETLQFRSSRVASGLELSWVGIGLSVDWALASFKWTRLSCSPILLGNFCIPIEMRLNKLEPIKAETETESLNLLNNKSYYCSQNRADLNGSKFPLLNPNGSPNQWYVPAYSKLGIMYPLFIPNLSWPWRYHQTSECV